MQNQLTQDTLFTKMVNPSSSMNDIQFEDQITVRDIILTKPFINSALLSGYSLDGVRSVKDLEGDDRFVLNDTELQSEAIQLELIHYREIKNKSLEDLGFRMNGHTKVKSDSTNVFWVTFTAQMIAKLGIEIGSDFRQIIQNATQQHIGLYRLESLVLSDEDSGVFVHNNREIPYLASRQFNRETGELYSSSRPKINPTTGEILTYNGQMIFSRTVLMIAENPNDLPKRHQMIKANGSYLPNPSDLDENGQYRLDVLQEKYKDVLKKEQMLTRLNIPRVDAE